MWSLWPQIAAGSSRRSEFGVNLGGRIPTGSLTGSESNRAVLCVGRGDLEAKEVLDLQQGEHRPHEPGDGATSVGRRRSADRVQLVIAARLDALAR
jgi:hypothetical protein